MKTLSTYIIICTIAGVTYSPIAFAQSANENSIPDQAISSFKNKYPNAIIKKWRSKVDGFIAKAVIDGHSCLVAFNKNGTWTGTTTKITWPWGLPQAVTRGYRKSGYYAWHVYSMTKFDTPSGQSYQIVVDDRNLQTDASHQAVLATEKLLAYKVDGTLISVLDISNDSLTWMAGN